MDQFHYWFYIKLPLIFPLCYYIHFINLYFMLHMTNTFHQKVKRAAFSVGFGEHCGDAMTHKLLDKIAQKNIYTEAQ